MLDLEKLKQDFADGKAVNPQNVRALIEEIERLQYEVEDRHGGMNMSEAEIAIGAHEFEMSLHQYISRDAIVEELRLLVSSMSTQAALAKRIGITPAYLSDILAGRRHPGPVVCKFLKIKAVVVYVDGEE
jgi:hypothetical protein